MKEVRVSRFDDSLGQFWMRLRDASHVRNPDTWRHCDWRRLTWTGTRRFSCQIEGVWATGSRVVLTLVTEEYQTQTAWTLRAEAGGSEPILEGIEPIGWMTPGMGPPVGEKILAHVIEQLEADPELWAPLVQDLP